MRPIYHNHIIKVDQAFEPLQPSWGRINALESSNSGTCMQDYRLGKWVEDTHWDDRGSWSHEGTCDGDWEALVFGSLMQVHTLHGTPKSSHNLNLTLRWYFDSSHCTGWYLGVVLSRLSGRFVQRDLVPLFAEEEHLCSQIDCRLLFLQEIEAQNALTG